LRVKSKVLYNEFNIDTKILEPKEFKTELEKIIDPLTNNINFIQEAIDFCNKECLVESYLDENDDGVETFAFRLPRLYFNFFNYVSYTNYPKQKEFVLTFRKAFKNFSRFIYYTESETLIDSICEYFGYVNKEELATKKNEFVYDNKRTTFDWSFEGGLIRLENQEDIKRPTLSYIISTK